MAWIPFRDLLSRVAAAYANNSSLGTANKYLILTDSSAFTDAATMLDVIKLESTGAGYARQVYVPGASSYDAGQIRQELPGVDCTFTAADGGTITYDRGVLVSGASATASKIVTTINDSSNRLEFDSNPNLSNDDKIVITADASGTVPSALLDSGNPRLLYVVGSGNSGGTYWIQCALTQGGSAIDFGAGVNPIRARYANGSLDFYETFGTTTLTSGQSKVIRVNLNFGGGSSDVNAA